MHPTKTVYRIITEEDEDKLREWVISKMDMPADIGFPTLMAFQGGRIVGCMVTQDRDDAVVCGPLIGESGIISVRLCELYESLLKRLGVKEYLFYVDDPDTSRVLYAMRRKEVEFTELGPHDGRYWCKRRIA